MNLNGLTAGRDGTRTCDLLRVKKWALIREEVSSSHTTRNRLPTLPPKAMRSALSKGARRKRTTRGA
jgi:hypothetical protein